MPTAKMYNLQGEDVGVQELSENVFGADVNTAVLHQVVTSQLVNRRQGNAATKTRSMVSGGNRKPYKQKGTGNARQGSTRAPHFRHGGVAFGPQPHIYAHKIMRQMRRIAIRSALSDKVNNENLLIINDFTVETPRTRPMVEFLAALKLSSEVHKFPSVLVLLEERNENVLHSMRNIPYVKVGHVSSINVIELMKHDYLLLSQGALQSIEEIFDDGLPTLLIEEEA